MDVRPNRTVFPPAFRRLISSAASLALLTVGGCVGRGQNGTTTRGDYEVSFSATRLKDHALIASGAVPVSLGRSNTVHTSSLVASEEMPAVSRFTATLIPTKIPGLFQLVTKAAIKEKARNKKGKLKGSQRNQGSLLPIRSGETQPASVVGDPVQVEVRLVPR